MFEAGVPTTGVTRIIFTWFLVVVEGDKNCGQEPAISLEYMVATIVEPQEVLYAMTDTEKLRMQDIAHKKSQSDSSKCIDADHHHQQ